MFLVSSLRSGVFAITRNLELATRNLLFYPVSAVELVEKTAVIELLNELRIDDLGSEAGDFKLQHAR